MTQSVLLQPVDYARLAVDIASDKQAIDILMLDVRQASDFADYFVILTAESQRQMEALSEELEATLKRRGVILHHREGGPGTGWRLLDFGDLIVHLFGPDTRNFYHIEDAWPRATEVVRIQ